jgi:hypothetical protein
MIVGFMACLTPLKSRHVREGGHPVAVTFWIPAFAGMTSRFLENNAFFHCR